MVNELVANLRKETDGRSRLRRGNRSAGNVYRSGAKRAAAGSHIMLGARAER